LEEKIKQKIKKTQKSAENEKKMKNAIDAVWYGVYGIDAIPHGVYGIDAVPHGVYR